MGVIKRQSLKSTVINFIGTFIGFLSMLWVYPLTLDEYGYFQAIFSTATLIVPFLGLGIHGFVIRYAPEFEKRGIKDRLLAFSIYLATFCSFMVTIILVALYFIFYERLFELFDNFKYIDENKIFILILSWVLMFLSILSSMASTLLRIVIPDLLINLLIKIALPTMMLSIYFGYLDKQWIPILTIVYFIVILLAMLYYIFSLGGHSVKAGYARFDRADFKEMGYFMVFVMFNSLGASLLMRVDAFMIAAMISESAIAIYGILLTITNVIDIPVKALNNISASVLARSWAEQDRENLQMIYQKSSLFGSIIGWFLFGMLLFSWPDIIAVMSGKKGNITVDLATGVFVCLGLSKVFDISTGVNSWIISNSPKYRALMYMLLLASIINVILNYFLIQSTGITGAAIATLVSLSLFNVMKYLYVKYELGFQLEFKPLFEVLLGVLIVFGIFYWIRFSLHPLINLGIRSILYSILYFVVMYALNPGGQLRKEVLTTLISMEKFLPQKWMLFIQSKLQ
jgi:O-antigen/teichoic acid export membrane protein